MSTYPDTTRSVVVGLLLAALSAGSLIAFSLFAGEADNPTGASVSAWSFEGDPLGVVLGNAIAQEDATATTTTPAPPDAATDTLLGSRSAPDAVLGTRLRNRREGSGTSDRTGTSRSGRAARSTASSGCPCKGDRDKKGRDKKEARGEKARDKKARHKKKARRDNTPQGHAYGYHRTPSKNGDNGLARGHDKASPPARNNPPSRKPSNPPSQSAAKSRGKGKKASR